MQNRKEFAHFSRKIPQIKKEAKHVHPLDMIQQIAVADNSMRVVRLQ